MDVLTELLDILFGPGIVALIMLMVAYRMIKRGIGSTGEIRKRLEAEGVLSGSGGDRFERMMDLLEQRLDQTAKPARAERDVTDELVQDVPEPDHDDSLLLGPRPERKLAGESRPLVRGATSSGPSGDYPMATMGGLAPIGSGSISGRSLFDDLEHTDDHIGDEMSDYVQPAPSGESSVFAFRSAEQLSLDDVEVEVRHSHVDTPPMVRFRSVEELRTAFMLKEVLDRPRALRREIRG